MKNELIWCVDTGNIFGNGIESTLFLDEEEAEKFFKDHDFLPYRAIYQVRDIWGFRKNNNPV